MTNLKTTKRALFSSVLALMLCFAMLLGTTFAWFTDTAVSANNKIVAGTLDVELYQWIDANNKTNVTTAPEPVFDGEILWEPGMTQVRYLSIKNEGNLALKYKVVLEVTSVSDDSLLKVMEYAITPDATYGTVNSWDYNNGKKIENLGANATYIGTDEVVDVELAPGAEHFFALSVHMNEEAGNQYMNETVTFDIKVLAGQRAYEEDSFGKDYDALAGYPGTGFAAPMVAGQVAVEIPVLGEDGYKAGSVLVPSEAVADPTKGIEAKIEKTTYNGNFTIAAGMEKVVYDVSVSNLKEGNTAPIKTEIRIKPEIDPATVELYHYDREIDCNYDPYTGYVTFESATFSPFTVVFDAESVYVPKPALPENMPTAKVTYYPDWVGANIEWGTFGGFAPTEGKEAVIDAAFIFECPEEVDEAYKNWLCDFYVSLDQDLGENEIFLGGQYGNYLVGFHNGDLTLEAGKELPLLGAAISGNLDGITNWTYADVESFVGKFTCGVGNVGDSLNGATFTVALRLINPADTSKYYDVNTVTYTFGGNSVIDGTTVVTTGEGLQDAINEGATNITLGDNIDLSQGIVIPGN